MLQKLKEWINNKLSPLYIFGEKVDEHHLFLISAGIAFNIILYMIPLLLVALYLINVIFGADKIASLLVAGLNHILPPTPASRVMIESTVLEVNNILGKSTIAGWIGIISLLWLSSTLLSSIRSGLNRVFEIKGKKIFFFYRIKDIFLIIVLTLFILLASYALPMLSIAKHYLENSVPDTYKWILTNSTVMIFSMGISFLLYYSLFKFVPDKKMPRFIVTLSTIQCVVLVELSRNLFGWYLVKFGTYGNFYGTYAVMISIAVWIYYLVIIILLSAEISVFAYQYKSARKEAKDRRKNLKIKLPKEINKTSF